MIDSDQKNFNEPQLFDDEIDLLELIAVLWAGKGKIITITLLSAVLSVIYSLTLPNTYTSQALLAPSVSGNEIGGFQQLSSLASLAGVSLGSKPENVVDIGLETLKSRAFLTEFIERRNILVPLVALKSWNKETGQIEINSDIYDETSRSWVDGAKPSSQLAYATFYAMLQISKKNLCCGLVKLSINNQSPILAQQWVGWLVEDLNKSAKDRAVKEAKNSITFLEKEQKGTQLAEVREMIFQIIQKQIETIMLANVRSDYLFRIIDPSIIPEEKSSPRRTIICIVGTLSGAFLSVLLVLFLNYKRARDL